MTWLAIKALFGRLPLTTWIIGAAVAAGVLYHLHARGEAYEQGRAAERAEIAKANEEARRKADDAAIDVTNCRGRWDRSLGRCVPDASPGR
jgi:hypothetical protein